MLVVTRRKGQAVKLQLGEIEARVEVKRIGQGNVRICIDAPREVKAWREEIESKTDATETNEGEETKDGKSTESSTD